MQKSVFKAENREIRWQKDSVFSGRQHLAEAMSALDGLAATKLSTETSALSSKIDSDWSEGVPHTLSGIIGGVQGGHSRLDF